MHNYFIKDETDLENMISKFASIKYDISDDLNDRSFIGGIVNDKYATICNLDVSADLNSKETLLNATNKDDILSPLEDIYYSYDEELKFGGIRNYEDFEAIMLNDQSMLKELGVDSWVISQIMELYNKIDNSGSDYLDVQIMLAIPLRQYTDMFGYDFSHVNKDREDLITQMGNFELFAIGSIYASYSGNDENIFYGDGNFMKEESIGTVDNHSIKNYVKDCFKYYNLK